jgi:hypothetical protein
MDDQLGPMPDEELASPVTIRDVADDRFGLDVWKLLLEFELNIEEGILSLFDQQ